MKKTIVIFGSSMGTCQGIAEKIAEKLGVEAINVGDLTADVLNENENLLLGTSTWGSAAATPIPTPTHSAEEWPSCVKPPPMRGLTCSKACLPKVTHSKTALRLKTESLLDLRSTMRTRPTRPTSASMLGWHRLSPRCNVGKPTWRKP